MRNAPRLGHLAALLSIFPVPLLAQENPLQAPVPVKAAIRVPDFIRPGARLIYESGSSTENDDASKPNSAGTGLTRFDVLAVTADQVLINQGAFLTAQNGNGYTYAGGASIAFGDFAIQSGGALWMPKEVLAAMETKDPLQVTIGPFEINGHRYQCKTLTRITKESAMRQMFDLGTGLKLSEQSGVGQPRRAGDPTGFNRKISGYSLYQNYRQLDLPWLDAAPPAWVAKLRTLHYRGSQTLSLPGSQPLSVPFTSTLEVQQRGADWVQFAMTVTFAQGTPSKSIVSNGPGSTGSYWMNQEVLRDLDDGLVDEDELLGTRLTFAHQDSPMGRLGVLTETGAAHRLVWSYRLDDGALVYSRWDQPEVNTTIEVTLADRQ